MVDIFAVSLGFLLGFAVVLVFIFLKKTETDKAQNESIKDLERRLTDLLMNQTKDIRDSQLGESKALNEQIKSFTKETVQIREDLKQIQARVKEVHSFQEIFKSPKLRGQWGEASLEHILGQYFPQELWKRQHSFLSGQQVDAILKLPNGKILPIDSKFSSENFEKMINAQQDYEKKEFMTSFLNDIKKRVDEVSSKYILPSENTVDFALMYIPAEAIYYEIMFGQKKEDLGNYAWRKKIILTSPNTIYLTLKTIEHWFKDTQISRQTQEILKRLNRVNQDAEKLNENFRKLGSHLRNSMSAYESSEKRLSLFSERVDRLLQIDENKKLKD